MRAEALAAAVIGIAALWLLLQPLMKSSRKSPPPPEPIDLEETPKGIALSALKEIEFDRETGKLSDQDYELLKSRYTAAALEALRADPGATAPAPVSDDIESMVAARVRALRFASGTTPSDASVLSASSASVCSSCGPRPEPDAVFCSTCGRHLSVTPICPGCGAALNPSTTFCEHCGRVVAA
ncbi:MAG TPA: zinc ribbon domain-containing protein [Gemmatimonadales bacterium]